MANMVDTRERGAWTTCNLDVVSNDVNGLIELFFDADDNPERQAVVNVQLTLPQAKELLVGLMHAVATHAKERS